MRKTDILFDLDGTLTDPMTGITKSVRYALEHYGIKVKSLTELVGFIGPPLKGSFRSFYGFSDAQAPEAVEKYREYFAETGIFENEIYPGIPELLEALRITQTTTSSNIRETRRIIFRCPSVMGSKLPGQMAVFIKGTPWCICRALLSHRYIHVLFCKVLQAPEAACRGKLRILLYHHPTICQPN